MKKPNHKGEVRGVKASDEKISRQAGRRQRKRPSEDLTKKACSPGKGFLQAKAEKWEEENGSVRGKFLTCASKINAGWQKG